MQVRPWRFPGPITEPPVCEPIASGTADLQVAFFVDRNGDNVEQVDELVGYGAGPAYDSGRVDLRAAREIRVHTVVVSRRGLEDGRVEVRRRTHTTRELLRNLVSRGSDQVGEIGGRDR